MVVKKLLKEDLNVCKATEKFLFNFQSNIHRVELNRWVILDFFLGIIGSSHYGHLGGGGEYICLPKVPKYDKYKDGYQSHSYIYGTEYEVSGFNPFKNSLHNHDAPCAVCYVSSRATQLMIPARNDCPSAWTEEYHGYLMSEHHNHKQSRNFICVDRDAEFVHGSRANVNGALLYLVEGQCGSLPCLPYVGGRELTCAVCTKWWVNRGKALQTLVALDFRESF